MTSKPSPSVGLMRDLIRANLAAALGHATSFELEDGGKLIVYTPTGLRFTITIKQRQDEEAPPPVE